MTTKVLFNQLEQILSGANKLADAVGSTLGPEGRGVLIKRNISFPFITKDGVTVAESIHLDDPIEKIGAELLKEVARKTVDGAGDGTTTATILAQSILNNGIRLINSGANPIELKKGMELAVEIVVTSLKKQSRKTTSQEDLFNVANISTNGDAEMSKIISEAVINVGKDGVVRVEDSNTDKTEVILNKGMNLERGFISHHFVNNSDKMLCEFKNPVILLTDKRISTFAEVIPSLQISASMGKPLLIICEDIEGEALATLIMNKSQSRVNVCAIRIPYLSGQKNILLEDIAIMTGGKVISEDAGFSLLKVEAKDLGSCEELTVSKLSTVIIGGKGLKKTIDDRIKLIRNEIDESKDDNETKRLRQRLAKINGGVATIYIGGHTETEVSERKFRVEDAIYATIAAEEEGILPGGGMALYNASKLLKKELKWSWWYVGNNNSSVMLGYKIIHDAINAPLKRLCDNSNKSHRTIVKKIEKGYAGYYGWNAKLDVYGNMIDMGIVDPTKVVRLAVENSASVIGLLLTTKATIYETEQKPQGVF